MSETQPNIVCICGSTRFAVEIANARVELTLAGKIVLGPEILVHSDTRFSNLHDSQTKAMLDQLHLEKIKLSNQVFVVNPGGYIGDSTRTEIDFAKSIGRPINYLIPGRNGNTLYSNHKPAPPQAKTRTQQEGRGRDGEK